MAITMKRTGYGQVEPNHLSGIVTGQIYAQLPAVNTITQFENGQFAKYNYAAGQVDTAAETDGEYMLVYNEEKLYDERYQSHKDFVYKTADFTDGKIYPRLIRTYVGDIMTTNTIEVANTSNTADVTPTTASGALAVGNYLTVSATGFLTKANAKPESGMAWKVVKEYTMPDGQPGVKIQRVQ